jgi:hypothetical protein
MFAKIILAVSSERTLWNKQIEDEVEGLNLTTPVLSCSLEPKGTRQALVDILNGPDSRSGPIGLAYGDTVFSDDAFPNLAEVLVQGADCSLVATAEEEIARTDKFVHLEKGESGEYFVHSIEGAQAGSASFAQFGGLTYISPKSVERIVAATHSKLPEGLSQMLGQLVFSSEEARPFKISWAVNLNEPSDVSHAINAIGQGK